MLPGKGSYFLAFSPSFGPRYGFSLNKGEFVDALCLCYGFAPPNLLSHCVCGKDFSVSHAFSCPHGAFPILRHNDVRNLTAKLLSEVCHDVQVEPHVHLQPLSGEVLHHRSVVVEDDARVHVDIRASGFWWCSHPQELFWCTCFQLHSSALAAAFRRHEDEKCCAYDSMRSMFAKLSMVASLLWFFPGMGKAATTMYEHLAHLLNAKRNSPYSLVMGWLCCCLGFSLVHSSVRCLRGSRSTKSPAVPLLLILLWQSRRGLPIGFVG